MSTNSAAMTPAYDRNNIFAKILRGEAPCAKVYEDEYALAFKDIYPKAKVHVLAIPKGEYVSLTDFSQSSGVPSPGWPSSWALPAATASAPMSARAAARSCSTSTSIS